MLKFPSSIRQKILIGYVLSITVILTGAIFTYINLRIIEDRIRLGNVITEFFDTILEIRRVEKNYFLYGEREDYIENLGFVNKAEELIERNKEDFKRHVPDVSVADLQNTLLQYRNLMKEYILSGKDTEAKNFILEAKIRKKGKELVTIAGDISKVIQVRIHRLLLSLHRILVTGTLFLIVIGVVFGYVLLRTVTRPLKLLEKSMERISKGGLERVSINSSDGEIISLTEAFNKMLSELECRQRHLIQSEKLASLGTLLSGMAHELNNPLSNISTSCQILNEEIKGGDINYKKELLLQIVEQTERARDFVRSILEFSRPKELKKEYLYLKGLVDETISFVRGEVPKDVEIKVDVPDEIKIYADKQRIQQVFLNLIKNAIAAVQNNGLINITARVVGMDERVDFESPVFLIPQQFHSQVNQKGYNVYIKIQDNGVGIEPDTINKIFDPFFTTKEAGKGSGLGLFIVHEIIKEHEGSIKVESQPGQGTAFLIQLPQRKD